jgi:hypothetical protein
LKQELIERGIGFKVLAGRGAAATPFRGRAAGPCPRDARGAVTVVRYLLDTNICIYIAKRRPQEVAGRFERLSPGEVGMSMITYAELLFGSLPPNPQGADLVLVGRA